MLGGTRAAIVEADAMIAAMKAGLYPSFFIGRPSARLMTATSAVVDPHNFEKKKMKNPTTPERPPPPRPNQGPGKIKHPKNHMTRHQHVPPTKKQKKQAKTH